ncbi:unnamed protein product [Adineta steineri]|uniref:Uncharacterized protein n=1 Tax=Adineta steineri TaxID=433720 RepID=A0A814YZX1_9BILA|nr:unnamed protein product [Adineta steineri]
MTSIRPFSQLSRFIVSIGIIGLVLNDLLVVNGVIHQIWCFLHQLFLHLLLITIVTGHVLPDIYEYTNQYSHRCGIIFSFIILLIIQLFISMQWLKTHNNSSNIKLNLPILCLSNIRPQILIFIVHLLHLIFTIQSICTPIILDDTNSISSITIYINERFFQLYSILVRLFYFTGTSILHIFFLPGQFSGTLYSGILVIEIVLRYLIIVYHLNVRYERNIADRNNNTPYLSLKNDDLRQFSGTLYSGILVIEIVLRYLIIVYHLNVRYERNIADRNNNTPYLSLKNDDLSDDT